MIPPYEVELPWSDIHAVSAKLADLPCICDIALIPAEQLHVALTQVTLVDTMYGENIVVAPEAFFTWDGVQFNLEADVGRTVEGKRIDYFTVMGVYCPFTGQLVLRSHNERARYVVTSASVRFSEYEFETAV